MQVVQVQPYKPAPYLVDYRPIAATHPDLLHSWAYNGQNRLRWFRDLEQKTENLYNCARKSVAKWSEMPPVPVWR